MVGKHQTPIETIIEILRTIERVKKDKSISIKDVCRAYQVPSNTVESWQDRGIEWFLDKKAALDAVAAQAKSSGVGEYVPPPITRAESEPEDTPIESVLGTKTLLLDIETLPNLGYFFDTYSDKSIPLPFVKKAKSICTVAYKWLGSDDVTVSVMEAPYKDKRPCQAIFEQIEQADYVVGHYIKGFDIPFIEARLWHNQMRPLAQRKILDTYLIAKQKFKRSLNSNKLDHLAGLLQLGSKNKTDATLWVGCAEGDDAAINEMADYNIQDVILLEKVFLALRPQFAKQMNIAAHMDEPIKRCRVCGHDDLTYIGAEYTANYLRNQYRCNSCGAVSTFSGTKNKGR